MTTPKLLSKKYFTMQLTLVANKIICHLFYITLFVHFLEIIFTRNVTNCLREKINDIPESRDILDLLWGRSQSSGIFVFIETVISWPISMENEEMKRYQQKLSKYICSAPQLL